MNQMHNERLALDYDLVDELLWREYRRRSQAGTPAAVRDGSPLGALVELHLAGMAYSSVGASVSMGPNDRRVVEQLRGSSLVGLDFGSRFGLFPAPSRGLRNEDGWEQWCLRLQAAVEASGFSKRFAQGLVGATRELTDNIDEHSEHRETGLATFHSHRGTIEVVVADRGIGVLASLRRSPVYSYLSDGGSALRLACTDGQSRIDGTGRGYGISQVFRALAGYSGTVRLRSGDHALTISGDRLNLEGQVVIAQRAPSLGLTISIRCRAPDG